MRRSANTDFQTSNPFVLELASIFAKSILRLRQPGRLPGGPNASFSENPLRIARQDLEVPGSLSLSVSQDINERSRLRREQWH
jgi:hypothetical protein